VLKLMPGVMHHNILQMVKFSKSIFSLKRLALSGTDIGVNRPRAYGYLSAGGNPSTGSPIEPYVVNGPIFLNVGSVESGTQPMNIWVLYR